MQNAFIGDIGDFGKYGLLRAINKTGLSLAVNWYQVIPKQPNKRNDGKHTDYLNCPEKYRHYDSILFDELNRIVNIQKERSISQIEKSGLLNSEFFSDELCGIRSIWHNKALEKTKNADIVFLDPDNGLETEYMFIHNTAKKQHVKRQELKDYYDRGQSLILYQHLARITKKECIEATVKFGKDFLNADVIKIIEYPKLSPRFYFLFLHDNHVEDIEKACSIIYNKWNDFCSIIN